MFKVGLTGGIGSGKTTIANLFTELNTPVIDADKIAHQLVEKGQPTLLKLTEAFGNSILNQDGALDRAMLRNLVFTNPDEKSKLEMILHPIIFSTMQNIIDNLDNVYCIVCVPLLIETQRVNFVDRILVVDCPVETQIARVKQRDKLSETLILKIMASQVTRENRLAIADDVIDNSGNNAGIAQQVKKLHNFYHSTGASLR